MKVVSIVQTGRCYRLAFNGRVLSDSRGYSLEKAREEAVFEVNDDRRRATRDKRPIELILGDLTGDAIKA
jgi:hypothetical protein